MNTGFGLGTIVELDFLFFTVASFSVDSVLVTLERVLYRLTGDDVWSLLSFHLFNEFTFSLSTLISFPIRFVWSRSSWTVQSFRIIINCFRNHVKRYEKDGLTHFLPMFSSTRAMIFLFLQHPIPFSIFIPVFLFFFCYSLNNNTLLIS